MSSTNHTPRKIAIVGAGPSRRRAPFRDPSWEIWTFSSLRAPYPRVTRFFELHSLTDLRQQLATRKWRRRTFRGQLRFMRRLGCPVYMARVHPDIPTSVVFPIDDVLEQFGRIFTSTVSYLIALALIEGCDTIGLWGIDVKRKEYIKQKAAIKYLLSLAKKRGIKVIFARGTAMRIPKNARRVRTRVLYAYEWRKPGAWWRERVRRRWRRARLRRRQRARRRRRRA